MNENTGEMSYGFASNLRDALPNAAFIGFTGTPIEKSDANTRAPGKWRMPNVELTDLRNSRFGLPAVGFVNGLPLWWSPS